MAIFWLISLFVVFCLGKNAGSNKAYLESSISLDSNTAANTDKTDDPFLVDTALSDTGSQQVVSTSHAESSHLDAHIQTIQQEKQALINELNKVRQQLILAESKLQALDKSIESPETTEIVSMDEVKTYLSSPFDAALLHSHKLMHKQFKKLHEEPRDESWSIITEQHISDFFITHDLAGQVLLDAVTCKQTLCEIRGFELEEKAWETVMSDMMAQPWWTFKNSHSTTQNNAEHGTFFYALVSKAVL